MTGKFRREATDWNVETFMSIGAFDDKDRFEFLVATDLNLSVINSRTVSFKIRCEQGHQERFLKDRNPAIGAVRVFCNPENKGRCSNRLTEYDTNYLPPRRPLLLYYEHPFELIVEFSTFRMGPKGLPMIGPGKSCTTNSIPTPPRHSFTMKVSASDLLELVNQVGGGREMKKIGLQGGPPKNQLSVGL